MKWRTFWRVKTSFILNAHKTAAAAAAIVKACFFPLSIRINKFKKKKKPSPDQHIAMEKKH